MSTATTRKLAEEERGVAGNRHAEMGLAFLALTAPEFDPEGIEVLDFCYDDCRFIFAEYLNMRAAGLDPTDTAVMSGWFKRAVVIGRMTEAKLDWFDVETGKPCPFSEIFQLVIDGGFASLAIVSWYKSEVRRWRVVRAIRYISYHVRELIDSDETQYQEAIAWLADSTERLQKLAASITPENSEK